MDSDPVGAYIQHQAASAVLFRTAFDSQNTLKDRVGELESELHVWRSAHRSTLNDLQLANKALKDAAVGDPLAAVIIDGDGIIFDRRFISRGRDGGREAGIALATEINRLADDILGRSVQIICTVFLNVKGLSRVLSDLQIADTGVFNDFMLGFSAAHPLFTMVDVGIQKEAADAKIRENVALFSRLPSVKLVLAGVGHDGGYSSLIQSLETGGLIEKVYLLKGYTELAFELERLKLKQVTFNGLFETKKLVVNYSEKKKSGYTSGGGYLSGKESSAPAPAATPTTPKSLKSALKSTPKPTFVTKSVIGSVNKAVPVASSPYNNGAASKENATPTQKKAVFSRLLDPKKRLVDQVPPPCNNFYLEETCPKGKECRYGHDYLLNSKNLAQLALAAKSSPCVRMLKDGVCSREGCISGHSCPFNPCKFGSMCKFKAAAMHPKSKPAAARKGGDTSSDLTTSDDTSSDDDSSDISSDEN